MGCRQSKGWFGFGQNTLEAVKGEYVLGPRLRCGWANSSVVCIHYHDTEWGVPTYDPRSLFERLTLESMQAGLSWLTVLNKRDRMRRAFLGFDPMSLAKVVDIEQSGWLEDSGLIRHRGKLNAMVTNARLFNEMTESAHFFWSFVQNTPLQNSWRKGSEVPGTTDQSIKMSNALKKMGFAFVGPTICYAFMQSAGMVNDHLVSCFRHTEISFASNRGSKGREG